MRERMLTPALVFVTLVVAVISSLGAPLLPLISHDLHVPLSDAQWSLTAALLSGAVSAPVMGRLGDGEHRRIALTGGLGVVLLGGIVAALATSLPVLVTGRAMQGIGLGLVPLGMAVARDCLPPARVGPAIALLSVSAAAGVGVGYPVSGLIAEHAGLHAAFWSGAAFSALALAVVFAVVPRSAPTRSAPLDLPGAALLSTGLVALLLAIGQGGSWGWGSARIVGLIVAAVVLLVVWTIQQTRADAPLVELRLLRHRAVLTANAAAFLLGVAMYLNVTVVTTFVQIPKSAGYGFGASVLTAGLCLVPFSIMSLLSSRLLPAATRLLGPSGVLPVGCLVVVGAASMFALAHGALWESFATMGALGVGMGFTYAAIPGLIIAAVPAEETGSAMGFYQVIRYIGFAGGSALAAAILAGHTPAGAHLPAESGYVVTAWASAGLCAAAAVVAWALPAHGGRTPGPREQERYAAAGAAAP